jgi:hypothetical protein
MEINRGDLGEGFGGGGRRGEEGGSGGRGIGGHLVVEL